MVEFFCCSFHHDATNPATKQYIPITRKTQAVMIQSSWYLRVFFVLHLSFWCLYVFLSLKKHIGFDNVYHFTLPVFLLLLLLCLKVKLKVGSVYEIQTLSYKTRTIRDPSKTMKNVLYFIRKALFILKIFKFLYFFPSFPHFPDSKGQMEVQ